MNGQQILTEKEIAAALRCSVPAIRLWRKQGLPALRLGRLVRFRFDEVVRWFENRPQSPYRGGFKRKAKVAA
jgi:excisionase family DNA binding protein